MSLLYRDLATTDRVPNLSITRWQCQADYAPGAMCYLIPGRYLCPARTPSTRCPQMRSDRGYLPPTINFNQYPTRLHVVPVCKKLAQIQCGIQEKNIFRGWRTSANLVISRIESSGERWLRRHLSANNVVKRPSPSHPLGQPFQPITVTRVAQLSVSEPSYVS